MKREFALDDALRMLEVLWAALPASPPNGELSLAEVPFPPPSPPPSPNVKHIRENAYTKVCAIRRQSSSASIAANVKRKAFSVEEPSSLQSTTEINGERKRFFSYNYLYLQASETSFPMPATTWKDLCIHEMKKYINENIHENLILLH